VQTRDSGSRGRGGCKPGAGKRKGGVLSPARAAQRAAPCVLRAHLAVGDDEVAGHLQARPVLQRDLAVGPEPLLAAGERPLEAHHLRRDRAVLVLDDDRDLLHFVLLNPSGPSGRLGPARWVQTVTRYALRMTL